MKRTKWLKLFLLLVVPALLFTVSCAKKTVKSDEAAIKVAEDEAAKKAAERVKQEAAEKAGEMARRRAIEEEQLKSRRAAEEKAARDRFVSEDIHFEFDKSSLLPEAQAILRGKAEWLLKNPGASVVIEGHCDERGTNEYNIALGDRRAKSTKNFLINLGVAGSRLETISYGEEQPVDPGHNEEAWAKNRRAHFVIR